MVGVSCRACGDGQPGPPAEGDGESCPGGGRSVLQGLWGRTNGHTGLGGWGVQPRGWSETPARPMGGHLLQRTGRTGLGGTGSPAQGVVGASCQAYGGPPSSENRAHRPRGDGESSPGGVRSLLPGQWGANIFGERGAPAWGGRGVQPRGCSEPPAWPTGGHLLQRTGRTGLGGTGSPAQGVFGVSCQANGGPSSSENRAHRPGGGGESCPGGVRSLLPGQWGAIFFREPGAPSLGGRGVQPRGCSESPARPMGGHLLQRTGRTGLGGTGSPAQGVFGVSCKANGGPSSSENRAHRPGGDGESCPGNVRSLLPGPMGGHLLQRTGRTGLGGMGSPAQGVFGVSCKASGGPSSSENRAHRPGGDGESCPKEVRSLLPGPTGGHLLQRTGRTWLGGTGSPAQGVFGVSCQGQWGAIFFREPGAPAWGGRGVQPRGCSESPARPMGGHLLQRTKRTGPGGTGSPAQGVFGVSCKAIRGPSSSENRAHRPGGDRESCPGGVRSLLPGQWGAIFFREPGAPGWGGRGVLPRGCSESPARPVGGHLLQRTGRTGLGGTGSPAQGVFGVSCKASGGPSSSENRAHRPGGDGESSPGGVRSLLSGQLGAIFFREPSAPARGGRGVLPRGCSESPARPPGGHLLQRTRRTGPGGTGSPAQGVFGVSCQANGGPSSSENRAHLAGGDGESCPGGVRSLLQGQWGAIFFREPGAPAPGGRRVQPWGCSESPARANGGPSSSENRAHRPGGDGESCPGGVRSLLQGQWGAIFFREPGAPARGGRGVLPRGCSESPPRPMGGHLLRRTGHTGLGGTGSSAQGVFGASGRTPEYSLLPLSSSRQVSRQYLGS